MKNTLFAFALATCAWAAPISPVSLTGGGTFGYGYPDGTYVSMYASGIGAAFSIETYWGTGFHLDPGNTVFEGTGGWRNSWNGSASIGSLASRFFSVHLSYTDQPGTLALYDGINGNMIASTHIDALQSLTTPLPDNFFTHTADGTFTIGPTLAPVTQPAPAAVDAQEPSTLWLLPSGLLCVCVLAWRRERPGDAS